MWEILKWIMFISYPLGIIISFVGIGIEEISNIHNALSGQAPSLQGRAGEGVFPLEVFVHGEIVPGIV